MDEALRTEAIAVVKDIQATAIDNCYSRYDIWAQLIGVGLAVGGGGLLSVLMPGGVFASATLAALVMGATTKLVADEADKIEKGDIVTIQRYFPESAIQEAIAPLVAKVEAAKKPLAQGTPKQKSTTTATATTSQSPEPIDGLPMMPVALDDAAPHLYLWGRTQNGKTETLKYLLQGEKIVHYVTSKGTDTVPIDWHGWQVSGKSLGAQVTWLLDKWEMAYQMHQQGRSEREWFVIDEAVGIVKALTTKGHKEVAARLVAFIVEVLTAGASQKAYLALLSQTSNSGPIQVDLDILKNCRVVACSKGRRDQMIAAFTKLTDYKIKPAQEKQIEQLNGYWQLWDGPGGPTLSQIEPTKIEVRAVQSCPVSQEQEAHKDYLRLLERIATEIKKQAMASDHGHITVRAAAQCLPGDRRKEIYPQMPELCKALADLYPDDFKVFKGIASEDRVAYLKSPNYEGVKEP